MNNSRILAVKIIDEVLYNNAYSNILLRTELNKSKLNDKDKGLVTEIVYGTIKYKYSIDKILNHYLKNGINKVDKKVLNILRISIYQLEYLDKVPSFAAVNEAVEMAKKVSQGASKLVNGVLRNYLRNKDIKYYDDKDTLDKLSFLYSFPKELIKIFITQYGEEIGEKILQGLNKIPDITVRVNNLKSSYEEVMNKLTEFGYEVEEGEICPEAIRIIKGRNIEDNPLFNAGCITVQDESAMLVAPSMNLKPNMYIVDLCSAPGGKTTHIGEIMNNTGQILAFDIHEHKLNLIKNNAERLGVNNIKCDILDATVFNEQLVDKADRVLMDVPCSGFGIIRKKPEIKWNKSLKDVNSIIKIQKDILINGSKYVKKDGFLIYSTCTLNKRENEENINWFIKKFPQFAVEPLFFGNLDNIIYDKKGMMTILPNDNMDGFFIAKLRRLW